MSTMTLPPLGVSSQPTTSTPDMTKMTPEQTDASLKPLGDPNQGKVDPNNPMQTDGLAGNSAGMNSGTLIGTNPMQDPTQESNQPGMVSVAPTAGMGGIGTNGLAQSFNGGTSAPKAIAPSGLTGMMSGLGI